MKYFCGIASGDVPILKNFRTTTFSPGEHIVEIKKRIITMLPQDIRQRAYECISNEDRPFVARPGTFVFAWET